MYFPFTKITYILFFPRRLWSSFSELPEVRLPGCSPHTGPNEPWLIARTFCLCFKSTAPPLPLSPPSLCPFLCWFTSIPSFIFSFIHSTNCALWAWYTPMICVCVCEQTEGNCWVHSCLCSRVACGGEKREGEGQGGSGEGTDCFPNNFLSERDLGTTLSPALFKIFLF